MDIFPLMRKVSAFAFDSVFPLRTQSARINTYTTHDLQLAVTTHRLLKHTIVTLLDYQDKSSRELIHALKYERSTHAAHLSAQVLAQYLNKEIASLTANSERKVVLMPVPLHTKRLKQRGYNQITRVLDQLPTPLRDGTLSHIDAHTLIRTRDTPHQTALHRSERLKNVAGAFEVTNPSVIHNSHVFLIDDVSTTGATLVSAGAAIRQTGAHVTLLSLARA